MKKLLLLSSLTILLFSCKGNYEEFEECYCGEIISDDAADYSIVATNECSGNDKKFIFEITFNSPDTILKNPILNNQNIYYNIDLELDTKIEIN